MIMAIIMMIMTMIIMMLCCCCCLDGPGPQESTIPLPNQIEENIEAMIDVQSVREMVILKILAAHSATGLSVPQITVGSSAALGPGMRRPKLSVQSREVVVQVRAFVCGARASFAHLSQPAVSFLAGGCPPSRVAGSQGARRPRLPPCFR